MGHILQTHVYTIILPKSVGVSKLQVAILGRCLKLFVPTESISCHEFASQFGLAVFLYAKNTQNYCEYRVAHTNVYLNEAATAYCLPVTVGRSPATTYMNGDNNDHSGARLSQNGEMQQVKMATTRGYTLTA